MAKVDAEQRRSFPVRVKRSSIYLHTLRFVPLAGETIASDFQLYTVTQNSIDTRGGGEMRACVLSKFPSREQM